MITRDAVLKDDFDETLLAGTIHCRSGLCGAPGLGR
jgi:hypothetical protein